LRLAKLLADWVRDASVSNYQHCCHGRRLLPVESRGDDEKLDMINTRLSSISNASGRAYLLKRNYTVARYAHWFGERS